MLDCKGDLLTQSPSLWMFIADWLDQMLMCAQCGNESNISTSLKCHMAKSRIDNVLICPRFRQVLPRRAHLPSHLSVYEEKPYACSDCGKSFARGGQLIVHQRVHSGDKPYSCSDCGAQFTSSGNLKTHAKLHENSKVDVLSIGTQISIIEVWGPFGP